MMASMIHMQIVREKQMRQLLRKKKTISALGCDRFLGTEDTEMGFYVHILIVRTKNASVDCLHFRNKTAYVLKQRFYNE